jgi:thiamine-phosphate pyrophosphorylase
MRIQRPFFYPILDEARSTDLQRDAEAMIAAGVKILQLRCKKMSNADFCKLVAGLTPICKSRDVLLIINDRVDVCLVTDVSGVHLGQDDFPVIETRHLLPRAIIGLSTHNIAQFQEADRLPVDYISIGPIFATTSKANPDPVVGLELLRKAKAVTSKPIVCIGGITANEIPELLEAGASGIDMISEIYKTDDVFNNAVRLLSLFLTQRPEGTKLHE